MSPSTAGEEECQRKRSVGNNWRERGLKRDSVLATK
jgi:hypothetical protein